MQFLFQFPNTRLSFRSFGFCGDPSRPLIAVSQNVGLVHWVIPPQFATLPAYIQVQDITVPPKEAFPDFVNGD